MKPITHIIYDLDGLLIDTELIYDEAVREYAAQFGKPFPAEARRKMYGRKPIESATLLMEALELDKDPQEYLDWRESRLHELFPTAQPMKGAMELTQHLHTHNIPQAIATGSERDTYELKTSRHQEWFDLFTHVTTSDDKRIKQGKPAPDIFQITAQDLNADPGACLVFEDADNGVAAAKAAGMSVVAVPNPDIDRGLFDVADDVIESLDHFDPAPWGLPSR